MHHYIYVSKERVGHWFRWKGPLVACFLFAGHRAVEFANGAEVFLGLFWMYTAISVVIFYFSWKMQSNAWGNISDQGIVIISRKQNFAQISITIIDLLCNFLWTQGGGGSHYIYGLSSLQARGDCKEIMWRPTTFRLLPRWNMVS